MDESEKLKHLEVVQALVEYEALKNYRPLAIVNAIKEYVKKNLDLGKSVKELEQVEVTNIKYKVCEPLNTHLIDNPVKAADIQVAIAFLQKERYQVENYQVLQKSGYSLVFACSDQLKKLEHHGWLTLIDSTHKTNKYDYCLFTLYIYDGCEC